MLKAHTGAVRCVAFSSDGKLLITASDDKTVKVCAQARRWSSPAGKQPSWIMCQAAQP